MSKLNFCVWCGYELDHSEKFCPKCGSDLRELMEEEDLISVRKTGDSAEKSAKYEIKIDKLKNSYAEKEEKALELINKSFNPDELTYSRFVEQLNRSHDIFYKKIDVARELSSLIDESSVKIEDKLEKTIGLLEEMLEQLNLLIVEFIIHPIYDKKSDEEIDVLREDMDDLINSVKKYQ